MSKLLKIIGRIAGISAEWILILFLFFAFAIRTYPVQTFIAQKAASYLSSELGAEIKLEALEIIFFDRVLLKNVHIKDRQNQTLLLLEEMDVRINSNIFFDTPFGVDKIKLSRGEVNISRDKLTGIFNFQFIADYFEQAPDPTAKPIDFGIDYIELDDVDFNYNDFRKPESTFGFDHNHIGLNDVKLAIHHFKMADDQYRFDIKSISCKDRSGIYLTDFQSSVFLKEGEIGLNSLLIETDSSKVFAPQFTFHFDEWADFSNFSEEVEFNVRIDSSKVSLGDIAFFVHDLKGMNDVVTLKGNFTDVISALKITDLDLHFGTSSFVKGDFQLPSFSDTLNQSLQQQLSKAHLNLVDVYSIQFPLGFSLPDLDPALKKNEFLSISNMEITGSEDNFDFKFDELKTALGELFLPSLMNFNRKNEKIRIQSKQGGVNDLFVRELNIDDLLNENKLGKLKGILKPEIEISNGEISLKLHPSELSMMVNDYNVSKIRIEEGTFKNNHLKTLLIISDENVMLDFACDIDLDNNKAIDGVLNIDFLNLDALNLTSDTCSIESSSIAMNLIHSQGGQYQGQISSDSILYRQGNKLVPVTGTNVSISIDGTQEHHILTSSLMDAEVQGRIDWMFLFEDFKDDLSKVFPTLKVGAQDQKKRLNNKDYSDITFNALTRNMDDFLALFEPNFPCEIQYDTGFKGEYNSMDHSLDMTFSSSHLKFSDLVLDDVYGIQSLSNDSIFCDYIIDQLTYNDSLNFKQIEFFTDGSGGMLNSNISWAPGTDQESMIEWETKIHDNDHIDIILKPSYFSLDGLPWRIVNESDISYNAEDVHVDHFELRRDDQLIQINGCLSENDFDQLRADLENINISELGLILGVENKVEGSLSGWASLSNPSLNPKYMGDIWLKDFFVDEHFIGDLLVHSNWDKKEHKVNLRGELDVDEIKTFEFYGFYGIEKEVIDLFLDFDNTDIAFVNSLLDPKVVSDISGKVNGKVHLLGSPARPELDGILTLKNARAKLELLGVHYSIDGDIEVRKDMIALNSVPLNDEEGNTGSVIGTIFHQDFDNWNFDIQVNFEDDMDARQDEFPFTLAPLDQFLILNTTYREDDVYYGKAYGRGNANISGSANNLAINLDLKTVEGTKISFPMYGVSEIEEDFDFVTFVDSEISESLESNKTDLTGIDLDLNFKVTPDAEVKIIFNPDIGDEIVARGSGDLNMTLDQYNEINLTGYYEILGNSTYNFAMGIIKQDFDIEGGSLLTWTGDPYNANIDLVTSFRMKKVSLVDLSAEQIDNSLTNQEVVCYLNLGETLLKPKIAFDIKAPNAPETGKGLINRVVNDEDELNRQFFSLLLLRKFQPLKGTITAGGSAALDMAESQINAILGQVSKDYDLNFNSAMDELLGENSLEFGVSKSFLEDRLIVSGSFGIENRLNSSVENGTGDQLRTGFIGDIFVEYLINEAGTFRATAFNQSNTNSLDDNAGPFTQGAGLSYHEDFNNSKDFKLLQYFFDIFRPKNKKRYPIKKSKRQTKIE